jgi:hypothetical protein
VRRCDTNPCTKYNLNTILSRINTILYVYVLLIDLFPLILVFSTSILRNRLLTCKVALYTSHWRRVNLFRFRSTASVTIQSPRNYKLTKRCLNRISGINYRTQHRPVLKNTLWEPGTLSYNDHVTSVWSCDLLIFSIYCSLI